MEKSDMLECIINYYTDGNKARFAAIIGVKPQTINTWSARNTFDAELIYSKCEGISGDWLLGNGEGEMLKTNNSATATGNGSIAVNGNNNSNVVAGGEIALLQERVKALEALLAEKERLIQVLMEGRK
ncbi:MULTISPECIES: hypothetical protein [Mediterranea]|uniref:hypothetical protein n=1 Tax=Mediterranea TaxID=1926659 RepID=UPI0020126A65|nr:MULTISPECIES: hypothetical protein [Mediterranea]MCL1606654.1 hypothetical protein [Mediterranea sp. ET5]MDM8122700.1 hypothetical protein [Mediterranea massiliensis]MDM8197156.1 hypothetical protein [Mediterranea massiliensis]